MYLSITVDSCGAGGLLFIVWSPRIWLCTMESKRVADVILINQQISNLKVGNCYLLWLMSASVFPTFLPAKNTEIILLKFKLIIRYETPVFNPIPYRITYFIPLKSYLWYSTATLPSINLPRKIYDLYQDFKF